MKPPKEKLTFEQAVEKTKSMTKKDAFDYLYKNFPKALMLMRPESWSSEKPDPNFVAPITKDEIDNYLKYLQRLNGIKSTSGAKELSEYLASNKYAPQKHGSNNSFTGKTIIENAKSKGAKMTTNEDGSFTIYDDETTYTDSDAQYGKGRVIHPDVRYSKNTYKKGNDLVNVYDIAEMPKYGGRTPTAASLEDYKSGKYYTEAATPEMKRYYADVYFDPKNANEPLTYGSQSNVDDIDRYKYANQLGQDIKPFYTEQIKKQNKQGENQRKLKSIITLKGNYSNSTVGF